jgi:tetratricopeptide (TPR) repeat protein
MTVRRAALLAFVFASAAAGCSTTPVPAAVQASPVPVSSTPAAYSAADAFERQWLDRATAAARQGQLADAAWAWEVLLTLRPASVEYRVAAASLRRQIDAVVSDRTQRAAQSQRKGDIDGAVQNYLAALAAQPDYPAAAEALRAIERERVKRQQLGRLSRYMLTRRASTDAEMMADAKTQKAATAAGVDRNELEHVSILARQGEIDAAIAQAERRVATDRNDKPARELLADLYQRKAEDLVSARDFAGAIALLDKSLRLDPTDTAAADRLKQLRASAAPPAADVKPR